MPREPARCAWYEGCCEPSYTSTPISLCQSHAAVGRILREAAALKDAEKHLVD